MSILYLLFIRVKHKFLNLYLLSINGFSCWLYLLFILNFELVYLAIFTLSLDCLIVYIVGSKSWDLTLIEQARNNINIDWYMLKLTK